MTTVDPGGGVGEEIDTEGRTADTWSMSSRSRTGRRARSRGRAAGRPRRARKRGGGGHRPGYRPPPYQAAALEGSALLWSAQDDEPPFKIARVFDFAKPDTGPGFHPEHRVVTDAAERDRMLEYLTSGTPVLHTTARTRDVLNPDAGQVVPTSFRTDGEWIWTDTVAYYLEQHGMAPDEELAAHIEARWQAGDTSAETDSGDGGRRRQLPALPTA